MTDMQRTLVRESVDKSLRDTRRTDRATTAGTTPTDDALARQTIVTERTTDYASGWTTATRVVTLLFGILQVLLILRIVLLLLAAEQGNAIVASILAATDAFVEPFRGVLQIDHVAASGSVLDVAAGVSLIAWTLVEALIVAIIGVASRRAVIDA